MKSPIIWSLVALHFVCLGMASSHAESDDEPDDVGEVLLFSDRETGFRFEADALIWNRTDSGSGGRVIGGPQGFSLDNADYSFQGGYRLTVGYLIDSNYEVEGMWTDFAGWSAGGSGVLTRAVSFDGGQNSLFVDPSGNANFINTGTFFRPLYDAATDPVGGTVNDETTEFEFLRPGSSYTFRQFSDLSDAQVNFKSRRTMGRRVSLGLGYRNIRLNEGAQVGVTGTFDAFDVDGDEAGVNGPNDQLSDQALTNHGLTLISGGGGFNDPTSGGGVLSLLWNGSATNQLNGIQGVVDGTLLERGGFSLDANLRSGIFYNRISGSIVERYSDSAGSVYGRSFFDEKDTVAFAANIGLVAAYQITERLRIRGGYEAMFLTNVGLGASQQQGVVYDGLGRATYSVQSDGSVVLHGVLAGLEYNY